MGSFDTKGEEFEFLIGELRARDVSAFTVDFGVREATVRFPVDCRADVVALRGGGKLEDLRHSGRRDRAMEVLARGARETVRELWAAESFDGMIGMGGGCGTSIITAAMRELPLGVPKVCLSTLAGGDVSSYVGTKDIVMMPSLADLAGLNRLSRRAISQAAGALCGMIGRRGPGGQEPERPLVFASSFGNTQQCVDGCGRLLAAAGCETIVFHATGGGGRLMESLIREGLPAAVLDLTTTEMADWLCGGAMSAGPERLTAAGAMGLPQVVVPGCLDMVNFSGPVPARYRVAGRKLYRWNSEVTLMRTNAEENRRLGRLLAERANAARGPVAMLLPRGGFSALGAAGEPFSDPEADAAFIASLRAHLNPHIAAVEVDAPINDPALAARAVDLLRQLSPKLFSHENTTK